MKASKHCLLLICLFSLLLFVKPVYGWSNSSYSANSAQPDYGTHDWIAQHALDYLPAQEKQYITDNLATYLYGTELPDRPASQGGIGDTTKHHIYYSASGTLVDDASAQRAKVEYDLALNNLKTKDYASAAKAAGAMTHYIADIGVFGHVMGASTPWGAEKHHSDYEDYVNARTSTYGSTFITYLSYDGSLTNFSAYNATVNLAYDTTFGGANQLTCNWMDANYNWNNPTFSGRSWQSLNLAVNEVADVLHTLYVEAAASTPTPTPSWTPLPSPTLQPIQTSTVNLTTEPTNTSVPTNNPHSSTIATPKPSATQIHSTTPIIPEFPIQLLAFIMVTSMATAILYKKSRKKC